MDPKVDEQYFIDFLSIFHRFFLPKSIEILMIFDRLLDESRGNENIQKSSKTTVNTKVFEGSTNLQDIKNQ